MVTYNINSGIEVEEDYVYVLEIPGSLKGKDELINQLEIADKSTFGVNGAVSVTQYTQHCQGTCPLLSLNCYN